MKESISNKEAIILFGHGSRVPGAGKGMEKVAEVIKEKYGSGIVEVSYMSRLGPHFNEIFEKCVNQGATRVMVIPYFLNEGLHIKLDIPKMLQREAKRFPDIDIIFGKHLGYDEILADLVWKRIQESAEIEDVRNIELESEDKYPLPEGQREFVPMSKEEAEKYLQKEA